MTRIDISVSGEIWEIHLNEDSSKEGVNFLDNEIWANGTKEEMRYVLEKSLMSIAVEENVRLVPGIVERIIKVVGLRI